MHTEEKTPNQIPMYFDQRTAPCGEHAFRKAIKRNAFPAWRVGKKLLARSSDVISWIESSANLIEPMVPANSAAVKAAGGGDP